MTPAMVLPVDMILKGVSRGAPAKATGEKLKGRKLISIAMLAVKLLMLAKALRFRRSSIGITALLSSATQLTRLGIVC